MAEALPTIAAVVSTASAAKSLFSSPKTVSSSAGITQEEQTQTEAEAQEKAKRRAFQQRGRAATRLSSVTGDDTTAGLATKRLLG